MADSKISELTDGGALQDADEFVVARAGENRSLTGANVLSAVVPYTGAINNLNLGANDFSLTGSVEIGSTPAYTASRKVKVFDDGVDGGARMSLVGTLGQTNGPALELVFGGDSAKRCLIRGDEEGGDDYGLTFFTTKSNVPTAGMALSGNQNLSVVGSVSANGISSTGNISTTTGTVSAANLSASDDLTVGDDATITGDLQVDSAVQFGSTPSYTQTRHLKIFDDGVNGNARMSLIGTGTNSFTPALEMVIDGALNKRTLVRMDSEGSNDYGLNFFTTNNNSVGSAMTLSGNKHLDVVGDISSGGNITADGLEATLNSQSLILKSPNGARWRVQVDNAGALTTTSL